MSLTKRAILLFGDVTILYVALAAALFLRGEGLLLQFTTVYLLPFTILNVIWIAVFYLYDFYSYRTFRSRTHFVEAFFQAIVVNSLISIAFFYLIQVFEITPKTNLALYLVVFTLLFVSWRWIFGTRLKGQRSLEKIALVLPEHVPTSIARDLLQYPFHEIVESDQDADRIVSDNLDAHTLHSEILAGKSVSGVIDYTQDVLMRIPVELIDTTWITRNIASQQTGEFRATKRAADVLMCLILSLSMGWLFVVIAPMVKFSSSGPVFYKQQRLGFRGRPFTIVKFRTMTLDAEADGVRWAEKNDRRVTSVGKILRHTHLDELPQLWNIFRGDMSFVGPRPERPEFATNLEKEIPNYSLRHLVKPGLTGWAQINHGYGATVDDVKVKLSYDLYYVLNQSVIFDAKIWFNTIASSIKGENRL